MERIDKGYGDTGYQVPDRNRDSWTDFWLASTGKFEKSIGRLDSKMKGFIAVVAVGCFSVSTIAGASIRTVAELHRNANVMAASYSPRELVEMPISKLMEIRI